MLENEENVLNKKEKGKQIYMAMGPYGSYRRIEEMTCIAMKRGVDADRTRHFLWLRCLHIYRVPLSRGPLTWKLVGYKGAPEV